MRLQVHHVYTSICVGTCTSETDTKASIAEENLFEDIRV
jgi:hypothetical protein